MTEQPVDVEPAGENIAGSAAFRSLVYAITPWPSLPDTRSCLLEALERETEIHLFGLSRLPPDTAAGL